MGTRNLLLVMRYHGGFFHGSAIQKNAVTVQGTLQPLLERLTGETLQLKCCSRTDAGVHARMFCISFHTRCPLPCRRIAAAANALLPEAAAVTGCLEVPADFHARYSCVGKRYCYRIDNSRVRDPLMRGLFTYWPVPLDAAFLNGQAQDFLGAHDFSAFCASGGNAADRVRSITRADVRREGDTVLFEVAGDGFLYHMVRIMAGTLLAMQAGKILPGAIPRILDLHQRNGAGPTAPPEGLYLEEVYYDSALTGLLKPARETE